MFGPHRLNLDVTMHQLVDKPAEHRCVAGEIFGAPNRRNGLLLHNIVEHVHAVQEQSIHSIILRQAHALVDEFFCT